VSLPLAARVMDAYLGGRRLGPGELFRIAQALTLCRCQNDQPGGRCAVCGEPLQQPATGRRRRYCGPACRRRAERGRVKPGETRSCRRTRQEGRCRD
jgi:hypothetical protein